MLDATFVDLTPDGADTEAAKGPCAERVAHTREFFGKVVEEDGVKDRSGRLALLELEKRSRHHGLTTGGFSSMQILS